MNTGGIATTRTTSWTLMAAADPVRATSTIARTIGMAMAAASAGAASVAAAPWTSRENRSRPAASAPIIPAYGHAACRASR